MTDTATTAAALAIALGLVEIVKALVKKISPDKPSEDNSAHRMEKIQHGVARLVDMHDVRDSDGTPIWYFPRSVLDSQERVAGLMNQLAAAQERLVQAQDKIAERLDDIKEDLKNIGG